MRGSGCSHGRWDVDPSEKTGMGRAVSGLWPGPAGTDAAVGSEDE